MDKRKGIMIVAILGLLFVTVGVSYAAFTYIGQGQKTNTVQTGNLTFVYDESNREGNGISISNATPTTDEEGKSSLKTGEVFEFSVSATTKGAPIYYEIYVTKQENSTLPEKIIKTYLTEVQGEEEVGIPNTLTNQEINTYPKLGISKVPDQEHGKTLYQEMIPEGQSNYAKTFRYRMWVSDTATEVDEEGSWKYNDMSFTVKVNVYASNEPIAPPEIVEMKTWASNSREEFRADEYRTKITRVQFSDTTKVPESAISSWDVSAVENNGDIMAYLEDDGKGGYVLTLGGEGGVGATDLSYFLINFTALESIDFTNLDTSNVTNMAAMFSGCSSLTSLDLSGLDTSNVTNMSQMFRSCESLQSLDLNGLDTSSVIDMSLMFYLSGLTSLELSGIDTSSVTNMNSMFSNCSSLTNLDLSGLDTSNVTNMGRMFSSCSSLTSLDLSGLDASSVTDMNNMFGWCHKLSNLNLDGFHTSHVTRMEAMFYECRQLTRLDLSGFDTSKVTNMMNMFSYCNSLSYLDLSSFRTSSVTTMRLMFSNCSSLSKLDLTHFDTSGVTDMYNMFGNCTSLTSLNLSSFITTNVTTMGSMFDGCSKLEEVDFRRADFSNVTDTMRMFFSVYSQIRIKVRDSNAQLFIKNVLRDLGIAGTVIIV